MRRTEISPRGADDRGRRWAPVLAGLLCLCGVRVLAAGDPAAMLNAGRAAMEDGIFDVAVKQFEAYRAAEAGPSAGRDEATRLLLESLQRLKQHEAVLATLKAEKTWSEAATRSGLVPYWRALALYDLGRTEDALKELAALEAAAAPDPPIAVKAMRLKAGCLLAAGRPAEAIAVMEALDRTNPDSVDAVENLLDWSKSLIATGGWDQAAIVLARLATTSAPPATAAEGAYWLGRKLVRDRKWGEAVVMLTAVATNRASGEDLRAKSYLSVAVALDGVTNRTDALAAVSNALRLARNPEVRRQCMQDLGGRLLDAGRLDEGVAVLKRFVAEAPADPASDAAQLRVARAMFDGGKFREAVDEYQGYLEAFTNSTGVASAYSGRGWALFQLGRHAEAAVAFGKACDLFKDPSRKEECLFKMGDSYFMNAQYTLAGETYERLLKEYPGSRFYARASFQRGESLQRGGAPEQAEQLFLDLSGRHAGTGLGEEALLRVAQIRSARGRWSEALEAFDQTLKTYTNGLLAADALHGRGLARYHLYLFDEAQSDFDTVVKQHPNASQFEQAFFMRAMCSFWVGRDDEAMGICRDFLGRYPASHWAPEVMFWVAGQEYNQGAYKMAESNFLAFVEKYGDDRLADEALLRAGRAAAKRKEYVRSVEILGRMAKRYPESRRLAEARFSQADALCELGDFSAAILICEEIINKYPNSDWLVPAWSRKADCQFGMGMENDTRYAESLESYRVVANSSTNNPNVRLELVYRAEYQVGLCLEKLKRRTEAFEQYYVRVVLRFLQDREKGMWQNEAAKTWFAKAAFKAADMKVEDQDWQGAVGILERVVNAQVPAAEEAAERIRKIRDEHWWHFR